MQSLSERNKQTTKLLSYVCNLFQERNPNKS